MQFSPVSCYFLLLWPKDLPQHPILEHLQPGSSLKVTHQVSQAHKITGKTTGQYTHVVLDRKKEDKRFWTEWWHAFHHITCP